MPEISVTQALAELKLIRDRLEGKLHNCHFITMKTKKALLDTDKFNQNAKSSYQSYVDLMERYNRMKSAIVISNAASRVKVGDREYTVAEAVERQRNISIEKQLLLHMKRQHERVMEEFESHKEAEQVRVDRLLSTELGKDAKTNVDVIKGLTETFLAENKAEIVDPLGLEERIKELEKSIEEFTTNINWALSEVNSKTLITL
jgi:hypothetical protein